MQSDAVLKSYNNIGLRLRLKISFWRKVKFGILTKSHIGSDWSQPNTCIILMKHLESCPDSGLLNVVGVCGSGLLKRKRGLHSNWWMTLISLSSRGFETGWSCSGHLHDKIMLLNEILRHEEDISYMW